MLSPRAHFVLCRAQDRIYLCGCATTVEVFDALTLQFSILRNAATDLRSVLFLAAWSHSLVLVTSNAGYRYDLREEKLTQVCGDRQREDGLYSEAVVSNGLAYALRGACCYCLDLKSIQQLSVVDIAVGK